MFKIYIYISLGFLLAFQFGCKKYAKDPFFSTYSPEARLTKGDDCLWTCYYFEYPDGNKVQVPEYHFNLVFKGKYGYPSSFNAVIGFSNIALKETKLGLDIVSTDVPFELSTNTIWSLKNSKKTLSLINDFEILRLTMNEMEIKDEKGNVYGFKKVKSKQLSAISSGIKNIPLFGIWPQLSEIVEFNSCEHFDDINATIGSTSMATIPGLSGNGVGYSGINTNAVFNFSHGYSKSGYITFWLRNYTGNPIIKLNGQQVVYSVINSSKPNTYLESGEWYEVAITVNSPGVKTVSVTGGVNGIDEIRYWEIQ